MKLLLDTHALLWWFTNDARLSARARGLIAEETLTGRNLFQLDDANWEAFQAALDRPTQEKPRLRRLLTEPSVFEQQSPDLATIVV